VPFSGRRRNIFTQSLGSASDGVLQACNHGVVDAAKGQAREDLPELPSEEIPRAHGKSQFHKAAAYLLEHRMAGK